MLHATVEFFGHALGAVEFFGIIYYDYDMWLLSGSHLCLMFEIILNGTRVPMSQFNISNS